MRMPNADCRRDNRRDQVVERSCNNNNNLKSDKKNQVIILSIQFIIESHRRQQSVVEISKMFILKSHDGSSFGLQTEKTYIIGRDAGGICLADRSVSRKHAEITIRGHAAYLKDLGSSNCTQINGVILKAGQEYKLKIGCEILFGKDSTFIFQLDELVITASSLSTEQKLELEVLRKKLEFQVVTTWTPQVTHVVIPNLVLTKKVVCALIKKQSIVTLNYFKARLEKIEKNLRLPQESSFKIYYFEDNMRQKITVDYDLDRSRIFKNKVFVFINNDNMKKMDMIIKLAGGTAISLDAGNLSLQKKHIEDRNTEYLLIVNDGYTQNNNPRFDEFLQYAKSLKRRSIPVQEITLSIVYGKTDVYCNSYFDKLSLLMSGRKCEVKGATIVPETQTQPKNCNSMQMQAVPESEDALSNVAQVDEFSPTNQKRRANEDINNQPKRTRATVDIDEMPSTSCSASSFQSLSATALPTHSPAFDLSEPKMVEKRVVSPAFNFSNNPTASTSTGTLPKLTLKRKRDESSFKPIRKEPLSNSAFCSFRNDNVQSDTSTPSTPTMPPTQRIRTPAPDLIMHAKPSTSTSTPNLTVCNRKKTTSDTRFFDAHPTEESGSEDEEIGRIARNIVVLNLNINNSTLNLTKRFHKQTVLQYGRFTSPIRTMICNDSNGEQSNGDDE